MKNPATALSMTFIRCGTPLSALEAGLRVVLVVEDSIFRFDGGGERDEASAPRFKPVIVPNGLARRQR